MSLKFAKKQGFFKFKIIERPIYVRNMNGIFNKKRPIENIIEVNIFIENTKREQRYM